MLESAEVGHRIAKATLRARGAEAARGAAQRAVRARRSAGAGPVLVLISGLEGGGRGETANKLNEWMDPRYHPRRTRSARRTGGGGAPAGVALLARAAAARADRHLHERLVPRAASTRTCGGEIDATRSSTRICRKSAQFEQMLTDEGIVLLKFWIHLSKRRARSSGCASWNPIPRRAGASTARRQGGAAGIYNKSHDVWEHMLRETSTGAAPWYVVEGTDDRYRNLTVGKILLDAHGQRSTPGAKPAPRDRGRAPAPSVIDNVALIRDLDLTQEARRRGVRARAREVAGQARAADAAQALPRPLADPGLRRLRRRRQGRRDPARRRRARCAAVRRSSRSPRRPTRSARTRTCGGSGGRSRARGGITIFDRSLVRPRAGRARRGLLHACPTGCAPTTRSTSSRSSWSDAGTIVVQVLAADQQGGAAAPLQGAREDVVQALQDHPRTTGATARSGTPTSRRSCDMVDRTSHRARAVDAGRGEGQALRAREDPEDDRQAARARRSTEATRCDAPIADAPAAYARAALAARRPRADHLPGAACARPAVALPARTRRHAGRRLLGVRLAGRCGAARRRRAAASCCSMASKAAPTRTTRWR